MQLFFKTFNPSGILLYTANLPKQADFAACYLHAGEAVCEFSAGTGIAILKSGGQHDDGQWHKVRRRRLLPKQFDTTTAKATIMVKILGTLSNLLLGGRAQLGL